MNITLETQPNCRAVFHIEIPAAEVKKERETVTDGYTRQAKLPGFRPGKAPKAVVAKKFQAQIQEELENTLVRRGYQEAAKKGEVDILNVLGVKNQSQHSDESYTFTLEVSTAPKFELPEYKGINVKLPRVEVGDEDVEHELLHLRERYQSYNDVERAAQTGDFVVLKGEGLVNDQPIGEAYPEAPAFLKKLDGNWFELQSEEKFLPGFFAGIVGASKDEERTINITLPEDFAFEPLRNQSIVYKVNIVAVKERVLPPLDEEFPKKFNAEWNLEQLRTEVTQMILQRREQSRDNAKTEQVIAHLADKLEFELPQEMVNQEAQRRTNDIARNAMNQGLNEEALKESEEQIVSAATQQARQNVKVSFILGEVVKKESLTVTEDQMRRALAQIAYQQRITPKKLINDARKNGLIDRLREDLLLQNAVQFLKDNAVVEETEPEKEDCGHDHSH